MSLNHKCHICGRQETGHYIDEFEKELAESKMCRNCNFWFSKIPYYGDGFNKHFVVLTNSGPTMYLARDSKPVLEGGPAMRGHGGRKFHVRFNNGEDLISTNVWCQGDVPVEWQDTFPVNAEFDWSHVKPIV